MEYVVVLGILDIMNIFKTGWDLIIPQI